MEAVDKPKAGSKALAKDTLLTPRFYTTDFDEMEQMFNTEMNVNLKQEEFEALLQEFKTDYNQTHFVRNPEFKKAAEGIQGPMRKIFVEFLERSCTAEFSGFLLYKELGRRLKVFTKSLCPCLNHVQVYVGTRVFMYMCLLVHSCIYPYMGDMCMWTCIVYLTIFDASL